MKIILGKKLSCHIFLLWACLCGTAYGTETVIKYSVNKYQDGDGGEYHCAEQKLACSSDNPNAYINFIASINKTYKVYTVDEVNGISNLHSQAHQAQSVEIQILRESIQVLNQNIKDLSAANDALTKRLDALETQSKK